MKIKTTKQIINKERLVQEMLAKMLANAHLASMESINVITRCTLIYVLAIMRAFI